MLSENGARGVGPVRKVMGEGESGLGVWKRGTDVAGRVWNEETRRTTLICPLIPLRITRHILPFMSMVLLLLLTALVEHLFEELKLRAGEDGEQGGEEDGEERIVEEMHIAYNEEWLTEIKDACGRAMGDKDSKAKWTLGAEHGRKWISSIIGAEIERWLSWHGSFRTRHKMLHQTLITPQGISLEIHAIIHTS